MGDDYLALGGVVDEGNNGIVCANVKKIDSCLGGGVARDSLLFFGDGSNAVVPLPIFASEECRFCFGTEGSFRYHPLEADTSIGGCL